MTGGRTPIYRQSPTPWEWNPSIRNYIIAAPPLQFCHNITQTACYRFFAPSPDSVRIPGPAFLLYLDPFIHHYRMTRYIWAPSSMSSPRQAHLQVSHNFKVTCTLIHQFYLASNPNAPWMQQGVRRRFDHKLVCWLKARSIFYSAHTNLSS